MPAENFIQLYEHERLITASVASVLNNDDIKALAPENAESEFKMERPRVDVVLNVGDGVGHFIVDADGIRRENGWHAELELVAITKIDFGQHSAYLAAVREIMSRIEWMDLSDAEVAPTPLLYHEIAQVVSGAASYAIDKSKGAYMTTLRYSLKFAIRPGAWPGGLG